MISELSMASLALTTGINSCALSAVEDRRADSAEAQVLSAHAWTGDKRRTMSKQRTTGVLVLVAVVVAILVIVSRSEPPAVPEVPLGVDPLLGGRGRHAGEALVQPVGEALNTKARLHYVAHGAQIIQQGQEHQRI